MRRPVRIAFRHLRPSEPVKQMVREKAARLERFHPGIVGCDVTLEMPDRHHRQGKHYRVRIEVTCPGEKLVVGRDPRKSARHLDLYAALNGAFREAARRLKDYARRQSGRVKSHEEAPRAVVSRLFRDEGYGFLATPEGREIYFHQRSVLDGGFGRLRVGTPVRYAEEMGEEGPQASTVAP